jgi:hypothetical protein
VLGFCPCAECAKMRRPIWLAMVLLAVSSLGVALSGCGNAATSPSDVPSSSPVTTAPTPPPIKAKVSVIVTSGGQGVVVSVNAGQQFKTTINSTICYSGNVPVSCPVLGNVAWTQTNSPTGSCSDAGSLDALSEAWVCTVPTYPDKPIFQACVNDLDGNLLGCASAGVWIQ